MNRTNSVKTHLGFWDIPLCRYPFNGGEIPDYVYGWAVTGEILLVDCGSCLHLMVHNAFPKSYLQYRDYWPELDEIPINTETSVVDFINENTYDRYCTIEEMENLDEFN